MFLAETVPEEKQALIEIYDALNGDSWDTPWNLTSDPCRAFWDGVSCWMNGSLAILSNMNVAKNYYGNNWNGNLPSAIGNLENLVQIRCLLLNSTSFQMSFAIHEDSGVSGSIPSSLCNIKGLRSYYTN